MHCDMFETVVLPIPYGNTLCGFNCTETFYMNFMKNDWISTPKSTVYGEEELGVLPLPIAMDKRMIGYWFKLLSKHDSAYSYCLYRIALTHLKIY